jgi:thioesterase domain-containing protein/acyl carrier protein
MPLLPNGKIDRRALLQRCDDVAPNEAYVEPRTDTELKLVDIWSRLLNRDRIGVTNDFFALGGKSLLAIELMNRIENEFEKRLPVTTLYENTSIEKLARFIDGRADDGPSEVIVIQPQGPKPPLFIVHGLGGELAYAHRLARHLDTDQPVYGLQSVDISLVRLQDLASRLVKAIRRTQPHGPYRLGGHCFAGILAFEIAQQLRALGCEVELLAIMDARLTPARRSLFERANLVVRFLKNLPFRLTSVLFTDPPDRLLLRFKARIGLLMREIVASLRMERVNRSLHDAVDFDRIRPEEQNRWQRDHAALHNYRPLPYDGRLLLVRAHTRSLLRGLDHDLGWSALVKNRLDVRVVPGHHANMFDEPQVGHVAYILAAALTEANRNGT